MAFNPSVFQNGASFIAVGQDGELILPFVQFIDFVGGTVTRGVGAMAQTVTVTFPSGAPAIDDESVNIVPAASVIDFQGDGVVVTDGGDGRAVVTIPGASGGAPGITTVNRTSTLALNTTTVVTWNQELEDDLGLFDLGGAPTLFTIPPALDGGLIVLSALLEGDGLSANISYGVNIERNNALFAATLANVPSTGVAGDIGAFVQTRPIRVATGDTFRCRANTGDTSWTLQPATSYFAAMYWPA